MSRPFSEEIANRHPESRGPAGRAIGELHDGLSAVEARVADLEKRFVTTTDKAEPAPTPVQAPRGFRVGDRVRTDTGTECDVSDVEGAKCWLGGWKRDDGLPYAWPASRLTLVHAADAPAEPDPALVERLANLEWINGLRKSSEESAKAILAFLGAESRLCAPGEVERLTKAREVAESRQAVAEDECADLRAQIAETKKNTASLHSSIRAWADRCGSVEQERDALRAELAEAEKWRDEFKRIGQAAEAELDAIKAKPRGKTRKVRAGDFLAVWSKASALGKAPGDMNAAEHAEAANAVGLRMKVKP